ncbi:PKD domain-containing protein [Paraferrimonas haliotis]|uniref:Lipoprotein n=1 Tax=Paraferrimonas haliotis TaxID=2013866 RepID=A0AA37WYA1_9GAMM|nr:hypothetical protein [Paraferrimonas haliotis]GLS84274.1 hypothetical protein GCM10007894_22510 [Paraferrimonas haliotis]
MKNHIIAALSIWLLSACGGSDDGDAVQPPINDNDQIEFIGETSGNLGQSLAIWASVEGQLSRNLSYQWRQTAGPQTFIADPKSPIAAATFNQTGNYGFEVTITDTSGNRITDEVMVSINNDAQSINVNRDHMVAQGNKVSLRLYSDALPSNVTWQQTGGPSVDLLLNADQTLATFDAPDVTSDTLLSFSVSAQVNGTTSEDSVHTLVTAEQGITTPYQVFEDRVARVYAYKQDSPYAANLPRCIYSNQIPEGFCNIEDIPLIGNGQSAPSLDDIMDKVIVSHDWMGENFEAFLTNYDSSGDLKRLLGATSAIVISYDVRPSFYWPGTAAIHLDPEDLWLTPEQRDTINEAPDYRADFGNELQFLMIWRYVKGQDYASRFRPREARSSRAMAELEPDLASLLYHELAHANDYLPPSVHASIQGPSLWDDIARRLNNGTIISDQISRDYPLASQQMLDLAAVRFAGQSPNATQKAYQPSDVTSFFEPDSATDFYSYSSTREDTAMMFEEAMMAHRYNIRRDVAVTNSPEVINSATVIVDWGQRGRVGEDKMQQRASATIAAFLPNLDANAVIAGLADPVPMRSGDSWIDNLNLSGVSSNARQLSSRMTPPLEWEPRIQVGRH